MLRRIVVGGLTVGAGVMGWAALSGAAPADVVLTPDSGPTGTTVQYEGTVSCPDVPLGGDVFLAFRSDSGEYANAQAGLGPTPYGEGGAVSGSFEVPSTMANLVIGEGIMEVPVTPGPYSVTFTCSQSSGDPGAGEVPFTVTATPTPTTTTPPGTTTTTTTAPEPPAGAPTGGFTPPPTAPEGDGPLGTSAGTVGAGQSLRLSGGGFEPGEDVHLVLYSEPVLLATTSAAADGTIAVDVVIPADAAPGAHTLAAFGADQVLTVTVQVAPVAAPAQAAPAAPTFAG